MTRICVFGDSIAYGRGDNECGGWVQRLRKFLDEKNLSKPESYFFTYNLGVDVDTTEGLLKRLKFETLPRMCEGEETIFIFSIGINDSCFVHKNIFLTSEENFKKNIKKLINLTQNFLSKIIFVGLTPVEEIKVTPLPWSKTGKSYKNENIQKYNEIIKSVCEENKIPFVEIFDEWMKLDYKTLLEDGLHPNSEGHRRIFEIVKDFLTENKII